MSIFLLLIGIVEQRRESDVLISLDEIDKRFNRGDQSGGASYAAQFQSMNVEDLLNMLKDTKSLHEEADILHYLFETK